MGKNKKEVFPEWLPHKPMIFDEYRGIHDEEVVGPYGVLVTRTVLYRPGETSLWELRVEADEYGRDENSNDEDLFVYTVRERYPGRIEMGATTPGYSAIYDKDSGTLVGATFLFFSLAEYYKRCVHITDSHGVIPLKSLVSMEIARELGRDFGLRVYLEGEMWKWSFDTVDVRESSHRTITEGNLVEVRNVGGNKIYRWGTKLPDLDWEYFFIIDEENVHFGMNLIDEEASFGHTVAKKYSSKETEKLVKGDYRDKVRLFNLEEAFKPNKAINFGWEVKKK